MGRRHCRTNLVIVIWGRGCCFVFRDNLFCYSGVLEVPLQPIAYIFSDFCINEEKVICYQLELGK